MKPMFYSQFFLGNKYPEDNIVENSSLLESGIQLYMDHMPLMERMLNLKNDYTSIPDLYKKLNYKTNSVFSKRFIYQFYSSGIVVGAGSGEDCIDLINDPKWFLYDLTDERMNIAAVGYQCDETKFNMVRDREGDTLIDNNHTKDTQTIKVISIDSLALNECEFISIDSEGTALDVLAGAVKTIRFYKPDLIVSIYHNLVEYLQVIPFLNDLGYNMQCFKTTNFMPQQPHLELTIKATFGDKE